MEADKGRRRSGRPSDSSQTLGRGLDVLALVAASPDGMTPARIAAALGLSRTIVYRLTGTLIEHRLIRRHPDGVLTAGLGTLALSANIVPTLRRGSRDILEQLAEELQATAHLVMADGDEALAVSVVEPRSTTFHVAYRTGSRTPITLGAIGSALTAAAEGRHEVFASEGKLVEGAKGVAAPVVLPDGPPCAVGVVTLASADTGHWEDRVASVARELEKLL